VKLLENGADAVKLEGAGSKAERIRKMVGEGILCVGHIGLDTEKAKTGGFRSVGKTAAEAYQVFEDALELQDCGVVWIELECVPFKVASEITKRIRVPTIGIGSGPDCDGQFLHCEDMLGMHNRYYPKHCKKYLTVYEESVRALKKFRDEVRAGQFPTDTNSFRIRDDEFEKFMNKIGAV
jgi:3-methyl-2-oxobutanoate hydroxymethyltransferase